MESISFALEMRDSMSGPARAIKTSLSDLRAQIKGTSEATIALQRAQINAKASGNVAEVKRLNSEIAHQRLDLKSLALQLKETTKAEKDFAKSEKDAATASSASSAKNAESLAALGSAGGLIAAAVVAIAAGAALAVATGAKMVLDGAQFRTHMTNAFEIMGKTEGKGKETFESIKALAETLPQSREATFSLAQELLRSGLKGDVRLENTVRSISQVKAYNEEAGAAFKSLIEGAQATTGAGRYAGAFAVTPQDLRSIGLSYEDLGAVLAKQIGKTNAEATAMLREGRVSAAAGIDALNTAVSKGRIGRAAKDAMMEVGTMWRRLQDNIAGLFDGVDMKPFLQGLSDIVDMFRSGSETGRGWAAIIQAVFGGLGTTGKGVMEQLQIAILDFQISLLELAIDFEPTLKQIRELGTNTEWINTWKTGFRTIADAALALANAILLIAKAFETIKTGFMLMSGASAVGYVGEALGKAGAGTSRDAKGLAASTVRGFILGMLDGVPQVDSTGAIIGHAVVKGAAGAKGVDAHSPSRAMKSLGINVIEGFDQGLATAGMGGLLGRIPISSKDIQTSGSGGGRSVSLGNITLNVTGVSDAASLPALLEPLFADLLDRIAEEVA